MNFQCKNKNKRNNLYDLDLIKYHRHRLAKNIEEELNNIHFFVMLLIEINCQNN